LGNSKKLCLCCVIALLGVSSLSAAQASKNVLPGALALQNSPLQQRTENPNDRPGFTIPDLPYTPISLFKNAIDVGMCSWSNRPSWCKGSDIGAWTNSAITFIGCGEVYIPSGTYTQRTTIVKPRCVKLHGASADSTFLEWKPLKGVAIVMGDAMGSTGFAGEGALEDLTLIGPGANTATCGVYLGGTDGVGCAPAADIDPSSNLDDHDNINRIRTSKLSVAGAFGVGVQWGNNAWTNTIFESDISFNGIGIYDPGTRPQTGENLSIISSVLSNNLGVGLEVATGNNVNFNVVNTSFDYNGSWQVQNGTSTTQNAVSLVNCYLASQSHWFQNYGYMNLTGVYANDGSDSGTLGYLIDNEAPFLTSLGGQFFNNGTGAILNPAGVASTWIAPLITSPGPNGFTPTATYIDHLGDIAPESFYLTHLNQNSPNQVAGTGTCSGGTQTVSFPSPFVSPPALIVFDETTKGGISLTGKGTWGFIVSCAGASDAFDWMVVGNPN
jgi:hypothetical protein